ncbi:Spo0E family sporulation regulatory protein-aspartic acid phosphatase [Metabacillus litoralis]|uniref:Spo0E family sporulation regulatory protein-aspartic acid phosphatase n=1 Tax=Metabacillus litoralis TaxID=152268 RepID=UPI0013CE8CF5|nr:Spo0E family sporulation regulatory protein-aspartic acid phosphatase [Metabacillus litoralis]UHA61508.1 Spo0E family sporulation regulatory protein-aspartic acid phosphatase [Metabacillus litoralis]
MATALTSNTLEILEKQLEKSINELQEDLKKTVKSFGLNSTRTIGKSKQLDKFIFELQLIKQLKKSL